MALGDDSFRLNSPDFPDYDDLVAIARRGGMRMAERPSTLTPPRRPARTADFAKSVEHERLAQDRTWGKQRHEYGNWMTILGEEYGEACEAACQLIWAKDRDLGWQLGSRSRLRGELVHLAAVAAAIIEHLDDESAGLDDQLAALEAEDEPTPARRLNDLVARD